MPILCDFTVIQGDAARVIGDDGHRVWEKEFDTGGRRRTGGAILMFMVRGLTSTNADVDVKINNKKVGQIEHYKGAPASHWFTQIINVLGSNLNNGKNELQIEAVSFPGAKEGNLFDDFLIRDVVCFFQQSS